MTDIIAGTVLSTVLNSSGSYTLLAGTHTVTASLTMAAGISLTGTPGAVLVIGQSPGTGVLLRPDSNTVFHGLERIAFAPDNHFRVAAAQASNVSWRQCVFEGAGREQAHIEVFAATGNVLHSHISVIDCDFQEAGIVCNVATNLMVKGNRFNNPAGTRGVRMWGSGHRVLNNEFRGGSVFAVSYLSNIDVVKGIAIATDGVISGNTIYDCIEESISLDLVGNSYASCSVRDYDVVPSTGHGDAGKRVVSLDSANWAGSSAYNNGNWHMAFVSGALAGNVYRIVAHANAAFLLDITDTDYDLIATSDGVAIQAAVYGIKIANNYIHTEAGGSSNKGSGVVLHGCGHGCTVANNVVSVLGSTGDPGVWALREADLVNIAGAGVTGLSLRAPVGNNIIINNNWERGAVGRWYRNYTTGNDYAPLAFAESNGLSGIGASRLENGAWVAGVRGSDDLPLPLRPDMGAVQDRSYPGRRFSVGGASL